MKNWEANQHFLSPKNGDLLESSKRLKLPYRFLFSVFVKHQIFLCSSIRGQKSTKPKQILQACCRHECHLPCRNFYYHNCRKFGAIYIIVVKIAVCGIPLHLHCFQKQLWIIFLAKVCIDRRLDTKRFSKAKKKKPLLQRAVAEIMQSSHKLGLLVPFGGISPPLLTELLICSAV